jgi:predicted NBD/HSP70 family sugar kinase
MPLLAVEVGGSSTQALLIDESYRAREVRIQDHRGTAWLLAAPGLVEGDRVRGAHHLGWMDVAASDQLGMAGPPALSMNDAEAAALGEWVLLGKPGGTTLYVGIGTGVGAVAVDDGRIVPIEFSHLVSFGDKTCGGCGRSGCLDAQIGGHALSTPLQAAERDLVIDSLSKAIDGQAVRIDRVVLGGGLVRANTAIVAGVRDRVSAPVHHSSCPAEYKSAAHHGLLHTQGARQTMGRHGAVQA